MYEYNIFDRDYRVQQLKRGKSIMDLHREFMDNTRHELVGFE